MIIEEKIGVVGYGRLGKSLVDYFDQTGFHINLYNRTKLTTSIESVTYTDDIENIITVSDIIFNALPRKLFTSLLNDRKLYEAKLVISFSLDLQLSEIKKYFTPNTTIQRTISSTAIKKGGNIILATPSPVILLNKIFPSAKFIYIEENLLFPATKLLSSSALSTLLIGMIKDQIVSKGFPIDLANRLVQLIPGELNLLIKTWNDDFIEAYNKSACPNGITKTMGDLIAKALKESFEKIK
ncbi:hypothetical protein JYT44_03210 [Caldithrix abyssi]|nr:hypothetical protein [Caldithrix abyssi]